MQYDFLIGHKIRVRSYELDKKGNSQLESTYDALVMKVTAQQYYEKIIVVTDDGLVKWFTKAKGHNCKKNKFTVQILDWDPGEKKEISRAELLDLEE